MEFFHAATPSFQIGEFMEFKKNDLVTVKIEDMGHDGEGIGKARVILLFIKDTVIGDMVEAKIMKAKKNYGYARLDDGIRGFQRQNRAEMFCGKSLWRLPVTVFNL